MSFKPSSLQRMFIIPFALLMLCLAVTIGWVLYRAGEDATVKMARQAVADLNVRMLHVIEHHLSQTETALRAVAPEPVMSSDGVLRPLPFPEKMDVLEDRLWAATGLFPEDTRYVYFGGTDGRFLGVNRKRRTEFEVRRRAADSGTRSIFRTAGPGAPLELLREERYDARIRPWYREAVSRGQTSWSPIYTDFTTREAMLTLSKPVYRADNTLIGVVSTDMELHGVTDALRALPVSANGIALVAERNGAMIATSSSEPPYTHDGDIPTRRLASASSSALVRAAYEEAERRLDSLDAAGQQAEGEFDVPQFGPVALSAMVVRDAAGLDWMVLVAAPRNDFRGQVTGTIYESLAIGLIAVLLALCLGFLILRWALRDIRKLTMAAKRIGSGEPFRPLNIDRRDEIGQLAQSFVDMEQNLRTDRLTRILNRDSLVAQIEFRTRSAAPAAPVRFALLFVDLDDFKHINDTFGHECGDIALIEVAARLQRAVRRIDAVARFGGDEFVVYLDGVNKMSVVDAICEDIRAILDEPIELREGISSRVSASIGAALYPLDGLDTESLLRAADARMYTSKRQDKVLE